jgi:hypothetical protein
MKFVLGIGRTTRQLTFDKQIPMGSEDQGPGRRATVGGNNEGDGEFDSPTNLENRSQLSFAKIHQPSEVTPNKKGTDEWVSVGISDSDSGLAPDAMYS